MGATLLLAGIITAIITAPLFDRVFTHHLAITSKILVPIIGVAWLAMIWAGRFRDRAWELEMLMADSDTIVKPNNTGALYALMAIIGSCSITMLPVGLELACELTRNADGSSAIIWFTWVALVLI